MNPTGTFLVVEDDPGIARLLERLLARVRPTEVAPTLRAGIDAVNEALPRAALVVDVGLPDGSGLDVVQFARQRWPFLPVLVLTGFHDPHTINRSHQLRAELLCKPVHAGAVLAFAERAAAFELVAEQRLSVLVSELSKASRLTRRETELVVAALGRERAALTGTLGVTENTLKSLVRTLLSKTGHGSLSALTRHLLRAALNGSRLGSACELAE